MKLPFSLTLKFVFRLLLPGFLLSLGAFPLIHWILDLVEVGLADGVVFTAGCVLFGWLFLLLDMPIYMLFEGRRYWPPFILRLFLFLEWRRLKRLCKAINDGNRARYLEASVDIRRFPMDEEGEYEVRFPTRLGNLLTAFEEYSKRVYGMDSIFFWPRIWICLDDDLRKELDDQQAIADSAVYASAALYTDALLGIIYVLLQWWTDALDALLPSCMTLLILAGACCAAGYAIYRISVHEQATFGELFKAVFDQYRSKVNVDEIIGEIKSLAPDAISETMPARERYKVAWRYLHNYRVRVNGANRRPSELR